MQHNLKIQISNLKIISKNVKYFGCQFRVFRVTPVGGLGCNTLHIPINLYYYITMIKIEENVALAPMTTFKVGGPAKYFVRVASADDLKEAIKFSKDKNLPIFILGGGSNLIISDRGFNGLVIKIDIKDIKIDDGKITCGAAIPFGLVVNKTMQNSLTGLEWAAGIPGTIGGAVRGNAGAFGGETKDVIQSVKSIDSDSGKTISRDNNECKFGYRDSIFKHNNEIVVEVELLLKKGDRSKIEKIVQEHVQYRQQKHPIEFPCAGSVFKNIPADSVSDEVRELFKDSIKIDPFPVVPAAKIIAEAGFSGTKIGGAQVSQKHTNYIVNAGNAKADDIIKLINLIKNTVQEKYQITLEIEPQLIGLTLEK